MTRTPTSAIPDRPVTCQDIVTLTIADITKRTYAHGNAGLAAVMVHAEYLAGIEALNTAALGGNVEQTKDAGKTLIRVVKRILATHAQFTTKGAQ